MSSLSQKDKNTLIILVVALLIFGIAFLGIKPAFASIKETKAINAELSAQKQTMKTEIEALPTYIENLDAAIIEYNKTGERVFSCKTNDTIHDQVVKIVNANNLDISSLTIGQITPSSFNNYYLIDGMATGGLCEGTISIAKIDITVSGSYNEMVKFIDYLNVTEGLYMQSISLGESTDDLTLSFPLYMVISDSYSK